MKGIGNSEFQELTKGMSQEKIIELLLNDAAQECPKHYGLINHCEGSKCEDCIRKSVIEALVSQAVEDEVTISSVTEEKIEVKTYKASEIIAMIESGKLELDDKVVDNNYDIWKIKKMDGADLINYAPFTISEKEKEVSFMEAVQAYSDGETIRCEVAKKVFTYIPQFLEENISSCNELIADEYPESSLTSYEILNGKWFIKR